jgi:flagellar hook-associated protein 2
MAGIQISGLLSNQAFDWKSVVDQLVAADGIPIKSLQQQQTTNTDKMSALTDIKTALQDLQDSVQAIRANSPFQNRTVSSDDATSTWKATSTAGAAVGTYKFDVTQLATATKLTGGSNVGASLNASSDVSALTLSTMRTASAVTAGTFTVNGKQVTIATSDTLGQVFQKISDATGAEVTASYDPTSDTVQLSDTSGAVSLGAANDTSNFLQVMKLGNNGTGTVTSSGTLGVLKTTATIASAGLQTTPTAVDTSGNGSFLINNVEIDYNINTDSIGGIINKINQSTAGVTATYDAVNDRVTLVNKKTGDLGITLSEDAGGLLGALGLTGGGASTTAGKNAIFTINDGDPITSATNTLDASVHGITGLSVTVNSQTTQTLDISSDTSSMQTSIQDVLDKFNAVQDLIEEKTKITTGSGSVTTSVLSGNHEVESWATSLQRLAFESVSGITGSVDHLDDLGIDFDGTTGHLVIKDSGKLNNALTNSPDDVQSFFLNGDTGFVAKMYDSLTNLKSADNTQQDSLSSANNDLTDQINTLQTRLDTERETLTNAFIAMLDAQSAAQSQNQALTNAFFKNSSN